MTKIYLSAGPIENRFILGRDHRKRLTKVMRLKVGDEVRVGAHGKQFICQIESVSIENIVLAIVKEIPTYSPELKISLVQAIMKGDRFEWLIEKATELGVTEIYPLITDRTVVRPANPEEKVQRWNEIAEQAAGQSENSYPALIHVPQSLSSFLMHSTSAGLKLLLHERESTLPLRQALQSYDGNHIMMIVGPEGGWSEEEGRQIEASEFTKIHLGPRVMRAETAGLALAALLQYELGNFQSARHARSSNASGGSFNLPANKNGVS